MRTLLSSPLALLAALTLAVATPACSGGGGKKGDTKEKGEKGDAKKKKNEDKKAPEERDGTSIDEVAKGTDLSGPVPPEISAVFFSVDGALIPLACFNKDKGKILSGKDCAGLVKKDGDVYLKAPHSSELDKIGDPKHALCEVGASGKPASFTTSKIEGGAAFDFGVFPKSAGQKMVEVSVEDTTAGDALKSVSDDEKKALSAAIVAQAKKATGEVNIHQVATLDVDGDKKDDTFISAFVVNPKDTARFLFSGLFMRSGAAPDKLVLVDKDHSDLEVFTLRGAIDLNGDGTHELWVNAAFNEGGGDRLFQLEGGTPKALGKYSCGLGF